MIKVVLFGYSEPTNISEESFVNHVAQHALNYYKSQLYLIYPERQYSKFHEYMGHEFLIHFNLIEVGNVKVWVSRGEHLK